jgi:2,4-dienoyl-CoA reductase-like NADH-dependent reductase (Old Yellow Enzyme family)
MAEHLNKQTWKMYETANRYGRSEAFGRPFINNPDLVERMANDWPLAQDLHTALFYTADEKGYTDYPRYKKQTATQ